jgi:hypothetical protein
MDRKVPINDATITRNAHQHIAGTGLRSPCHIQVQTRNGEVTLSGIVQYDHQRTAAVHAVRNLEGVKRVIENLKVMPAPKRPYIPPPPVMKPAAEQPQAATTNTAADQPPTSPVVVAESSLDPAAAAITDVLATAGESAELWSRIDIVSHAAPGAPHATLPDVSYVRTLDGDKRS